MLGRMMRWGLAIERRRTLEYPPMIRFSLFGVSVNVQPAVLLMLAVLGSFLGVDAAPQWLSVSMFVVVGFFCLLSHEMGHALVGRCLGGGSPKVVVSWLGGDCCNPDGVFTRGQGLFMTAAGPLFDGSRDSSAAAVLAVRGLAGRLEICRQRCFWSVCT